MARRWDARKANGLGGKREDVKEEHWESLRASCLGVVRVDVMAGHSVPGLECLSVDLKACARKDERVMLSLHAPRLT
jgi:hypothetical protein